MLQYGVYTRNRFRGLFDDLSEAIKYAGEVAVDLELKPADLAVRDSLENVRRWNSIDRNRKVLLEPALHLSSRSQTYLERYFKENKLGEGNDHAWIEPGGDVHCYETVAGGSRKLGTVDDLLRQYLAAHQVKEDAGAPRADAGAAHRFN
ncbi:hypothetical protein [Bradyrhizobium sp. S3.5.5]|uniref:hypothetical protein n=1 Tax=Bradyrhizobium sp. S3.5.5 TaxID=3156430 RepID=UPI003392B3F4